MYYSSCRLQNSPYFCVFKYARAVKQKVWNEAEKRERDWGETRKTLTPRVTDFFTDFEKKTDCFAVYPSWEVKVLLPLDSNILSSAYYTIIHKVSKKINKIHANIV